MNRGPLKVLVVDDDYRVASVHVGFVERVDGFRVVGEAHSVAETLALTDSHDPDLVLMDIYLPDGDGLAAVKQLLMRPSPPAVIVISAANDIENVHAALRLGIAHYLVKPFAFAALEDRLNSVLEARTRLETFPEDATQRDINALFDSLRSAQSRESRHEESHLAPTLQLVYGALASSPTALSASDVATHVGISRATAQRALTQLEQSNTVTLELKYGRAGRPEHCYSIRQGSRAESWGG
jgi:response regulator of citrate/malate metabolism